MRGVPASTSRTSYLPTAAATASPPASSRPSPDMWPPRRPAEAKTFFANERTFLAWLQVAVLLLLTGVSLLGNGGGGRATEVVLGGGEGAELKPATSSAAKASQVAGAVVAPSAVAFLAYAFFVFRRRAARLAAGMGGSEGYSDARGAALLACLALLAGVATLAAAFAKVAGV